MEENKTQIILSGECVNDKPFPVNEIGPKLELGAIYKIAEIFKCKCGEQHCNIGLELEINYVECYKCRERLPDTTHWCHSSRFKIK